MIQDIQIDDELTALWEKVYNAIVLYLLDNGLINVSVEIPNSRVKSIFVSDDKILSLTDFDGVTDAAEGYEDCVLYDVYRALKGCHHQGRAFR